jgi:metal-responsive CopG/Arc/MetJ family transcriptional regulator
VVDMGKVLGIKVELDDELEKEFEEIKKYTGIKSNSEIVRFLIRYFYRHEIENRK